MTTLTIDKELLEQVVNKLLTCWPKSDPLVNELRAALAAPATAPEKERYRWCVDNNLVLAGGTREFGWQIAPVGREWNRFIDAAMKGTP